MTRTEQFQSNKLSHVVEVTEFETWSEVLESLTMCSSCGSKFVKVMALCCDQILWLSASCMVLKIILTMGLRNALSIHAN